MDEMRDLSNALLKMKPNLTFTMEKRKHRHIILLLVRTDISLVYSGEQWNQNGPLLDDSEPEEPDSA